MHDKAAKAFEQAKSQDKTETLNENNCPHLSPGREALAKRIAAEYVDDLGQLRYGRFEGRAQAQTGCCSPLLGGPPGMRGPDLTRKELNNCFILFIFLLKYKNVCEL